MTGYTKLFSSILASTIWEADNTTRIVWITLLAMADRQGVVEGSVPGLATFARVSVTGCRKALALLQAPDKDSRSQVAEGRRIEAIDGGWRLINHAKYRAKLSADERREYLRVKQGQHRARNRAAGRARPRVNTVSTVSTSVDTGKQTYTLSTQAEADPDPDPEAEADPRKKSATHSENAQAADTLNAPCLEKNTLFQSSEHRNGTGQQLMQLWNELMPAPPFAHVLQLTPGRAAKIRLRLREKSLEVWRVVFTLVAQSSFCRGECAPKHDGDQPFVASFDWLMKNAENSQRLLEGQFGDRPTRGSHGTRNPSAVAAAPGKYASRGCAGG